MTNTEATVVALATVEQTEAGEGVYGPARGVRLTCDEQAMMAELTALYGESRSQVLRIALRHLFDRWTVGESIPVPEPRVS